jgi:DNA-binding NarL/FixJ family response regulator
VRTDGAEPADLTRWLVLVDDSPRLRGMLRRALDSSGVGLEIAEAGNAEELLVLLGQRPPPELVILDVNMPGRSGIDVLPDVRRQCPAAFITVLTGMRASEAERACLAGGANLFLQKDSGLMPAITALMAAWRAHAPHAPHAPLPGQAPRRREGRTL